MPSRERRANPVFRFARRSNGAYFYTADPAERDSIIAGLPDFRFEGEAFPRNPSGGTPVYRFANLDNGGYFYTASGEERDYVILNLPRLRYEGSSFSVATGSEVGNWPIYRLANPSNGAYLFTASPVEREAAVTSQGWVDEGIGFWVTGEGKPREESAKAASCANGGMLRAPGRYEVTYAITKNGRSSIVTTSFEHRPNVIFNGSPAYAIVDSADTVEYFQFNGFDQVQIGIELSTGTPGERATLILDEPLRLNPTSAFSLAPGQDRTQSVTSRMIVRRGTAIVNQGAGPKFEGTIRFAGFQDVILPSKTYRRACRIESTIGGVARVFWFSADSGFELAGSDPSFGDYALVTVALNGAPYQP